MENQVVRWAIIGLGGIARCFAKAVLATDNAALYGVASRKLEKAEQFKEEFGAVKAYGSYADAFEDPNVDAVYIATPHPFHRDLSIMAMRAGKAVLCEKPATMNTVEMEEVLKVREETGAFFMEAMWMRFQPAYRRVMQLVAEGRIGYLMNVYADICCKNENFAGSRMYEKALGGGACLDLGIYMLTFALGAYSAATGDAFSKCVPDKYQSIIRKTTTDVDGFDSVIMSYKDMISVLTASIDAGCNEETRTAKLLGTEGMIELRGFWYAQGFKVFDLDGNVIMEEQLPFSVNGYEYEVREVSKCILEGKQECEVHTHADSLLLARLIDKCIS